MSEVLQYFYKNVNIGAEKNDIDLDAITCFMTCVKLVFWFWEIQISGIRGKSRIKGTFQSNDH